jgi:hypothetical protein
VRCSKRGGGKLGQKMYAEESGSAHGAFYSPEEGGERTRGSRWRVGALMALVHRFL